nr:RNA polymerase sigma factor [Chryseobacterium bernardetii]
MSTPTETAFLQLVNQHKGILYKASRIYADSIEDREDLQQEILIQLWKSYQNFKGNSEFSTWMYRVAINTAITYLKKEKQRTKIIQILPTILRYSRKITILQKINSSKSFMVPFSN